MTRESLPALSPILPLVLLASGRQLGASVAGERREGSILCVLKGLFSHVCQGQIGVRAGNLVPRPQTNGSLIFRNLGSVLLGQYPQF